MGHKLVKQKVIVALSGGVDSAVAATLLKQEGYQVEGIFMKNWSGEQYAIKADCPWEQDQRDAKAVCETLNIPFRSVNFEKQYHDIVINYFFDEYKAGRTPNPDIMCNKEIKFKLFLNKAKDLNADLIATGHYARIVKENGLFNLYKGVDEDKDQSYFLYRLNQQQLSSSLFPIGHYKKSEVRELARSFKLPNAQKKDSQGICFVGKINVQDFLRENIAKQPGDIIDIDTKEVLGKHEGIMFYTIGQREGIGIGGSGEPYYVVNKDLNSNTLIVAKGRKHPALFKTEVKFSNLHFISGIQPENTYLSASIRYRHKNASGHLNIVNNTFKFNKPQRAITAGQSIVFYDKENCLGGAIIN